MAIYKQSKRQKANPDPFLIREIIIPKSENYYINIPKEYINQKVEILVLPFGIHTEKISEKTREEILMQTKGILEREKIDPIEWQKSLRDEYER